MKKVSEWDSFGEIGKLSLEKLFKIQGTVKAPILIFEQNGITIVQFALPEEENTEKLHGSLLSTIADLIRRVDPHELFVGYEGFYLMEEGAVRVLVGTLYSDDEEQVWLAQTHGGTVGKWQDISNNQNRLGFEGLWQRAKAHIRN